MTEKLRQANEENVCSRKLREHESQASKFEHTIQNMKIHMFQSADSIPNGKRFHSKEASRARETNLGGNLSLQKENERA